MAYYLGIDGGGSKTTCAVGDEHSLITTVVTGPSNITRVGEKRARESLQAAIREACAAAKINPGQVCRACVGVAGAGREEVASEIRKMIAELIAGEIEVVGDMPIALEAAFGKGSGVVVIAGTGSFAYGRDAAGKTARAGGWGLAISDEGSAHWIGRNAIREALRAADENGNTPALLTKLMEFQNCSFQDFLRSANANIDFAAFFPAIVEMAHSGDSIARNVLSEAGLELAQLAATVIARLFAQNNSSAVPIAIAGGVFRHAAIVRDAFFNQIRQLHQNITLHTEIIEPVHGALQMARRNS